MLINIINYMIWGCLSFKIRVKMAISASTVNSHVYIAIPDNIPISSIENWFGNNEDIIQDDNASCDRTKGIKAFPQERHMKSMNLPLNRMDLNPTEYLWWGFF